MRVHFCPSPGRYAVVRMDPVAMVEHLNDSVALAAAQAMQPKPYLAYIKLDLALPFLGKPWYSFTISPIGPFPRPPDLKQHITSDMCVAISPNESHPTGRPPLRTEPQFPYSNCYHWVLTEMDVRVAARPQGFDDDANVKLPSLQRRKLSRFWDADFDCIRIACGDDVSPMATEPCAPAHDMHDTHNAHSAPDIIHGLDQLGNAGPTDGPPIVTNSDLAPNGVEADDDVASVYSDISSHTSVSSAVDSVDAIMDMAIFGGQDGNQEILPLVHLLYDLTAHPKQEEIPSPVDLCKERDAIINIIQEARARNPELPPLDTHMFGPPENYGDIDSMTDMSDESLPHPGCKHSRPLKLLRKVKSRLQQLFRSSHPSS